MVVLYPHHAVFSDLAHYGLCESQVGLSIGVPVAFVEIHFTGVVMEKRPENGVGEAVIMLVGDIIVHINGLAGVVLQEAFVDDWPVLVGDEEASPPNPRKLD